MHVRLPIEDTLKARNFAWRLCHCSCASWPCRRLMNRPPDAREADLWQWGISAPAATSSRRRHWQKPWHRNLFEKGGSVDSFGIIRINATTWNKEMRHHNTDQLFISILCFARRISWVIMERRGGRCIWCWRIRARRNPLLGRTMRWQLWGDSSGTMGTAKPKLERTRRPSFAHAHQNKQAPRMSSGVASAELFTEQTRTHWWEQSSVTWWLVMKHYHNQCWDLHMIHSALF